MLVDLREHLLEDVLGVVLPGAGSPGRRSRRRSARTARRARSRPRHRPPRQRATSWASVVAVEAGASSPTDRMLTGMAETEREEELPAWSLPSGGAAERSGSPRRWPEPRHARVGLGRLDRPGVRVASSTAGSSGDHPLVGRCRRSRSRSARTATAIVPTTTRATSAATARPARGSSARSRPTASCTASRVLGAGYTGGGAVLLDGLEWAIEQGFDVVNLSLSTTKSSSSTGCTSWPTARTSSGRCSSRRRTTCRSRATRGGSRR